MYAGKRQTLRATILTIFSHIIRNTSVFVKCDTIFRVFFLNYHHSRIHDVKELKERLLSEWRLLDHTVIASAAIAQWCSRLNACVRVNGGYFEHKF